MWIKRIFYPIKVLGPENRIGVWVEGCEFHCPGCIAENLWEKDSKDEMNLKELLNHIIPYVTKTKRITISGGEPFLQEDLHLFLRALKVLGFEDILVYTGYTLEELNKLNNPNVLEALKYIDVLIDGRYIEALNDNLSLRGSSNQNIHFFNQSLIKDYEPILNKERAIQPVVYDNSYDIFGIFPKEEKKKTPL